MYSDVLRLVGEAMGVLEEVSGGAFKFYEGNVG